jgi:RimJ/RimL family protein N-acetyltransferase
VQSYLNEDPLHNIYLIHGLQTHGLDSTLVTFWGAFSGDQLEGVLFADNGYRHRFGSLAGDNPMVLDGLGKLALKSGIRELRGKSTYILPIIENLPSQFLISKTEHLRFYEVRPGQFLGRYDYPVRMATRDDIPLVVQFYQSNYGVDRERIERELIRKAIEEGGRCFLVELEGRVVSAARIIPQTDRAGMIDAGITQPEFRGRGIYSSVRTACYEYLFEKGKIGVALVSDTNAIMHKIMDKYGSSFTAKWLLIEFRRKPSLRQRIIPLSLRRWAVSIKDTVLRR